jgi:hypothetical protein
MCLILNDVVEQIRAHHEAIVDQSEQALAAKVCWTMPALSCVYTRVFVALTIENPVQHDALAVKDAELEQASAALTSKVCLVYLRMSGLTCGDWTDA